MGTYRLIPLESTLGFASCSARNSTGIALQRPCRRASHGMSIHRRRYSDSDLRQVGDLTIPAGAPLQRDRDPSIPIQRDLLATQERALNLLPELDFARLVPKSPSLAS